MIRVLMFDLGGTLIDANRRLRPHVRIALDALARFETADGQPLQSCLVSDYTMPPPPMTRERLEETFREYLEILEGVGLRAYFEPVDQRVTLSSHAGATKPSPAIFRKALERLHSNASFEQCLLVTEDADHVAAVRRDLGMQALRFGARSEPGTDFDDWSQVPALVETRIGAQITTNLEAAVQARMSAAGMEVGQLELGSAAGPWTVSGRRLHPVELPEFGTVHVAVPVSGRVTRSAAGELSLPPLDAEAVRETEQFARSLVSHGQVGERRDRRGATHAIETDAEGRKILVRKRFSAV
jgi:FMN phosphatase YigB (HAD superfamily)